MKSVIMMCTPLDWARGSAPFIRYIPIEIRNYSCHTGKRD
jgi:hypothetical protein